MASLGNLKLSVNVEPVTKVSLYSPWGLAGVVLIIHTLSQTWLQWRDIGSEAVSGSPTATHAHFINGYGTEVKEHFRPS